MKVCGIIGSPVKNGNVDLLVSQVLQGAASTGADVQKIYLNDLQIKTCQSCDVDPAPRYCIYEDDMQCVYDALDTCDLLVLGTPVYFDTVSAQVKLMIDRCNCIRPYILQPDGTYAFERRMKKKKAAILVVVAGESKAFDSITRVVKGFFNWVDARLVDSILYTHKELMERAFEMGGRLVGEKKP
jgi:multimeric flavodoxin WrbA